MADVGASDNFLTSYQADAKVAPSVVFADSPLTLTTIVTVAAQPPPSPAPTASTFSIAAQLATPTVDFGSDVLVFPGLDETFTLVNDGRVLAEALGRRLTTPRGAMPFHPDYGLDLRGFLNEAMTPDVLFKIKAAVERECELDTRVQTATAKVTYDFQAQSLRIRLSVVTASGPFTYTLNVTALTVALLGAE